MSEVGFLSIKIVWLNPNDNNDIPLPTYMTRHCSGMDVYAAIKNEIVIRPGAVELISTGFAMEMPSGFEAQIRPRSGLAVNNKIGILNSPGTIDADYRGEIKVVLINFDKEPFKVRRGDRIAQMVIARIHRADLNLVNQLCPTDRGDGGFGHTGFRS